MTLGVAVKDLIDLGWRDIDRLLAEHVADPAARMKIEEKIVDLRTAERLEFGRRLTAMEQRIAIALAQAPTSYGREGEG